ncbi:DUF1624 domain-containing protein [Rhizobiaceae bacterium BDR2-2]|uniref:DUF1624 domain-containing protein n=1 Tax=Ectorhizobium quercum TaxID=2965071 RepID=A0AAE3N0Q0_9HYPH|nr:DUF1624 domain-containing protein [Ectorhizobium quercum]MCX8997741.1 DUF1624 domain-containing protein [Ectorhizobium quercum]
MTGMKTTISPKRIPLPDAARGLALLAMASYHFTWDLEFFGYLAPGTATQGLWKLYARGIASSFLFLVGFSLVLAHVHGIRWKPFGKRLAMVAASAAAITVATLFAFPATAIYFGILHAIAAASVIGLLFLRLPVAVTLLAAAAVLAAPHYLHSPAFDSFWLLWLGLGETPPRSNDYVPLLPWLAPVLIGIAAGRLSIRFGFLEKMAKWRNMPRVLVLAGQHSLLFYLLHQPILIGIVYLASLVYPPPAADPSQSYIGSCETSCTDGGNEPGFCTRFCACTLDRLRQQELLSPFLAGQINPGEDERIGAIAESCSLIEE